MKIKRQETECSTTQWQLPVPPQRTENEPSSPEASALPREEVPSAERKKTKATKTIDTQQAIADIRDFLIKLAVVLLACWVLLGVVFGLAVVQGEDMYPRLRDGDLMVFYRLQQDYYIGDVVTFRQGDRRYTGRIVAQGGDTVDVNDDGELLVNGNVQSEEIFYPTQISEGQTSLPCTVPDGAVYLLCDFRTNGTDSRSYGPVQISDLDGKVITILRRRGI